MNKFNNNTYNKETYLTPPHILEALGEFDLDPCSPIGRPWDTAITHYTINDDGLLMPWWGRVWCNPPYGKKLGDWLKKMAWHANGIALTFARTDTKAFQEHVFPNAWSMKFIKGRLSFCDITGKPVGRASAPSLLIAYTEQDAEILEDSGIDGAHVSLTPQFIIVNTDDNRSWKVIVGTAMKCLGEASMDEIYSKVVELAPKRVRKNKHFKAKIRQTLQMHFTNLNRGRWTA